jgi:opacity protein-like surface antigen
MKKILLISSIIATCAINANAFYIGVEQTLSSSVTNETNSIEKEDSSNTTSLKIGSRMGTGDAKSSRVEFLYETGAKTSNLIVGNGKSVTSFGINYNATFDSLSPIEKVLPYVRLGVSYVFSSDKYINSSNGKEYNYSAAGLLIGLGSYYNITENIDVSVGYDIGYRKWQDLYNNYGETAESSDKFSKFYIGTNYSF